MHVVILRVTFDIRVFNMKGYVAKNIFLGLFAQSPKRFFRCGLERVWSHHSDAFSHVKDIHNTLSQQKL